MRDGLDDEVDVAGAMAQGSVRAHHGLAWLGVRVRARVRAGVRVRVRGRVRAGGSG